MRATGQVYFMDVRKVVLLFGEFHDSSFSGETPTLGDAGQHTEIPDFSVASSMFTRLSNLSSRTQSKRSQFCEGCCLRSFTCCPTALERAHQSCLPFPGPSPSAPVSTLSDPCHAHPG